MNVQRELRLALGMRGGVSLAVWSGGACAEIDELRRSTPPDGDPFWSGLVEACGYSNVVVDVLAGTSAGGLNGVLFAGAIRHGYPMRELLPTWSQVASINEIRRCEPPWSSLFDGDGKFLDELYKRLRELILVDTPSEPRPFVDLQLTATMVEPLQIPSHHLSDEQIKRSRSSALFHFRCSPNDVNGRDDLVGPEAVARLALAGRATSSFPVAFEAAVVRSTRPCKFGEPVTPDAERWTRDDHRRVDCRGVFGDSRGEPIGARAPQRDDDFVVTDGGIVDNIPLGRALDAIVAAAADGPTRRVLVYLHPTGPPPPAGPAGPCPDGGQPTEVVAGDGGKAAQTPDTPDAAQQKRRQVKAVAKGALTAKFQHESIDGDLEQLDRHNRSIRMAQLLRAATLARFKRHQAETGATPFQLDASRWEDYAMQRATADAVRLRRLLDQPVIALGEDPFPVVDDESSWRAPLGDWIDSDLNNLDCVLSAAFQQQVGGGPDVPQQVGKVPENHVDALFGAGIAVLRRTLALTLEWTRAVESSAEDAEAIDAIGDAKLEMYRLKDVVSLLERTRRIGWVTLARRRGYVPAGSMDGWCTESLATLDGLLCVSGEVSNTLLDENDSGPYLAGTYAVLQALVDSDGGADPGEGGTGLRELILERIVKQVDEVRRISTVKLPDGHPAELLDLVIRGPETTKHALADLEILCMPEYLSGRPGGTEIEFRRLSAAAITPLAGEFELLKTKSDKIGEEKPDGWTGCPNFLRPQVKLAGNELGNFSAFLDQRWRENDWMWGRLDSASTGIQILLDDLTPDQETAVRDYLAELRAANKEVEVQGGQDPSAESENDVRNALIAIRQNQIIAETLPAVDKRTWRVGLDTLNDPGSSEIQATAGQLVTVAANVLRSEFPGPMRWVAGPAAWIGKVAARWFTRPKKAASTDTASHGMLGWLKARFRRVK